MDFIKYEGLGNDFIVIDASSPDALQPADARRLCDRHFGIGADGVLLVSEGSTPQSRASMTVLNADGSRPEMCGNGLRCVALHLALIDNVTQVSYSVDTDGGIRGCEVERSGLSADVLINMGQALPTGTLMAEYEGRAYEFHRVSTGNPHSITFDAQLDVQAIDRFASQISAGISGGSNVEFVRQQGPAVFEAVIWERGVGRTLACGTGACALAAAAVNTGRARVGEALSIRLPGGELAVSVIAPGLTTLMRGPARQVFRGVLPS